MIFSRNLRLRLPLPNQAPVEDEVATRWNPLTQAIMGVQTYFDRNRLDFAPKLPPSRPRGAKNGRLGPKWEEGHACRIHDGER